MIKVRMSIDEMLALADKHENPSKIVLDALKNKTESSIVHDMRAKAATIIAPKQ